MCARSARLRLRGQRGEFRRRGIGAAGEQKIRRHPGGFPAGQPGGSDLPTAAKRAQPGINIILMVEGIGNAPPHQLLRLRGYPLLTKPLKIEELTRGAGGPAGSQPPPPPPEPGAAAPELAPAEFAGLVGVSERMKKIYRLISKVALQRHPVLIMGESGTGKELVARAIHTHGPWRDKPFVPVDCGALPPTLIESELFGHVKGAFTGAAQSRQGLLAAAGSGTVFLDEIGELPIELQSRLLRALQEHEIRPLGSNERIRFEARIIAATNQDLEAGIKRGTFRKDLFFRLNVVSIKMPSLRDRKEDIPALVRHFLARFGQREIGDADFRRSPGALDELRLARQRSRVGKLHPARGFTGFGDLHSNAGSALRHALSPRAQVLFPAGSGLTLQALEQQAIRQALQATGGDRVRAAKLLGIGKTTIYRKLKEYGIEVDPAAA